MRAELVKTEKVSDTMTNKKMTKKMAIEFAIANLHDAPADVVEKLQSMISQLDKQNASPKKLTATQEANLVLRDAIMTFLSCFPNQMFTCTELVKKVPELDGMTPQKVSALVSALVELNKVVKIQEKRKSYFMLKGEEE